MRLTLQGPWALIVNGTPDEYRALRTWLEALVPPDGPRLLHGPRFPAGLAPSILRAWGPEHVSVSVNEAEQPCDLTADDDPLVRDLRHYQREALEAFFRARRGIVALPPGAGKTRIAGAAMRSRPDLRWLYMVRDSSLVTQAHRAFWNWALKPGVCEAGVVPKTRIVVGTVGALREALKKDSEALRGFQGLIVDEVHNLGADTDIDVASATDNAGLRLGLSGTALLRNDSRNAWVVGLTGPVVYEKRAQDLVEAGFLAPGVVKFLSVTHPTGGASGGNFTSVYQADVVHNRERNAVVADAARTALPPRLIVVRELQHGVILQEILRTSLGEVPFVSGDDSPRTREIVFDQIRAGKIDTAIVSAVGQVGVDLPNVSSLINAAAGRSAIPTIQRGGRPTRLADGKFGFAVVDIADFGHRWLEAHAEARVEAYNSTGYLVDYPKLLGGASAPADVKLLEQGPMLPTAAKRQERPPEIGTIVKLWLGFSAVVTVLLYMLGACVETR